MADLTFHKSSTLPGTLVSGGVYIVDNDSFLDGYVVTSDGSEAKKLGYSIEVFQALKTTIQATTTTFTDVVNWDVPNIIDTNFTFDPATGVLTVINGGLIEVSAQLLGGLTANNRSELAVKLVDSSGDVPGALDRQYAMRNATQDEGSTQFNGFLYNAAAGETLKLQGQRVGSTANIITARFSIKMLRRT